jgi:multisubunit Na+/H+ antiporter MnhC subunit
MQFMSETEKSVPHEQLLVFTGLLAGFSFTALMLML